jgi:hypothetical protein
MRREKPSSMVPYTVMYSSAPSLSMSAGDQEKNSRHFASL